MTDGRTDRILITIPRLHCMQRGKNYRSLTNMKSHTGFRVVSKLVTFNDLERRNDRRRHYLCGRRVPCYVYVAEAGEGECTGGTVKGRKCPILQRAYIQRVYVITSLPSKRNAASKMFYMCYGVTVPSAQQTKNSRECISVSFSERTNELLLI